MSKYQLSDFKLEPAIKARRMMRCEAHTFAEVGEEVYWPTEELLRELAKNPPKELLCIAGKPAVSRPAISPSGKSTSVHAVLPDKSVIHLGSVMDQQFSQDLWQYRRKHLVLRPKLAKKLGRIGPTAMRREATMVVIPTQSPVVTPAILTDAVGRFFWRYVPEMVQRNSPRITWLNDEDEALAFTIERIIKERADAEASPHISTLTEDEILEKMLDGEDFDARPPAT